MQYPDNAISADAINPATVTGRPTGKNHSLPVEIRSSIVQTAIPENMPLKLRGKIF